MQIQFTEKELGDCLDLVIDHRGKTPKKLGADWVDRGIPTISAKNVNGGRLVATDAIRYVSHDVYKRWMKEDVKRGDCFLVSEGATLGECMMWDHDYPIVLGQRIFCLRANPSVLYSRYLYAYMTSASFQSEIIGRATGTSVDGLRQTEVLKLKLRLPPLSQQKHVGDTLYNLNKKIELNRRMNGTLESMARALFRSWFVDFDPVRTKLAGRPPLGLDPATAALFPSSFQDSEAGPIPNGWEVRSLDKAAHYLNGLALQKYPPGDGPTLPVIKIAQLRKGDSGGADRCNTDLSPNYVVQDGDVLFSWSGSLEVELWCGGAGALNQHLFKVSSTEFPKWFYYLWTLYHLDEFRLVAADKATTMGHIQRGHLTAALVLIPPRPLLDAMTRTMSPRDLPNRLVYIAEVTADPIKKGEYFAGDTYAKRPDCIYIKRDDGRIERRPKARYHDFPDAETSDLGDAPRYSLANALISSNFRYLGNAGDAEWKRNAPKLKELVEGLGQGHRVNFSEGLWKELNQLKENVWHDHPTKMTLGTPLHGHVESTELDSDESEDGIEICPGRCQYFPRNTQERTAKSECGPSTCAKQ